MNLPYFQSLLILIYFGNKLINPATIPTKYAPEIFKRNVNTEEVRHCNYKTNSDEAYDILEKIINDFERDNLGDEVTKKICKHIELWNRLGEIVKRVQNNCNAARKGLINRGHKDDKENKNDFDKEDGYGENGGKKQGTYRKPNFEESEEEAGYFVESADEYDYDKEKSKLAPKEKTSFTEDSKEKLTIINTSGDVIALIKDSEEDEIVIPKSPKNNQDENVRKKKTKTETPEYESADTGNKQNNDNDKPKSTKPEGENSKSTKPETSDDNTKRFGEFSEDDKSQKDKDKKSEGESTRKKRPKNKKTNAVISQIEYTHKSSDIDDASDALALIVDKNNFQTICNRKRYPIYADSEACKAFHAQLSK